MSRLEIDDTSHLVAVQYDIIGCEIPMADDFARRSGRQLPYAFRCKVAQKPS